MISVTPMPYTITVNPSGGAFFKPSSAEIYINGSLAGSGGSPLMIPAGKYRFDIKAGGYKTQSFDLVVSNDAVINVNLVK